MSINEILEVLHPLDTLFAWRQAGDEDGPRDLVGAHIASDEGLVEVLEKLTSIHNSSDRGSYPVLRRENVAPFLDFDTSRERVKSLSVEEGPLAVRARSLSQAFDDEEW